MLILESYEPYIQYILRAKNIVADSMSRLPSNGQPKFTHDYNYITETLLEIYYVE